MANHPELTSIVGCVSTSNTYSDLSKELIRRFFTRRARSEAFQGHVRAQRPLVPNIPGIDVDGLLAPLNDDVLLLDKLVSHIEPDGRGCPILIKKYAQQNGQIVEFNVDSAFSNTLDGFMVLSLSVLSEELRAFVAEPTQLMAGVSV